MDIIFQRNGKATYQGKRFYLDSSILKKAGFLPGLRFNTKSNPDQNEIVFSLHDQGDNLISKKRKPVKKKQTAETEEHEEVPVIDKSGGVIREALEGCEQITISIVKQGEEYRVIVKGEKRTATVKKEADRIRIPSAFTSITFCAGAGISSEAMKQAGFHEVAAVEWNPKEGNEDKFSSLYAENHQEAVVFNLPMEQLKAEHLPKVDVWLATLDCTDYSKSANGTKKEYHTLHLFMHLMRLFWEKPKQERPAAVIIENVPEFEKHAGHSLELCFKEEGFYVTKAQLDSLDYGSRTKRRRFFMVASMFEGFSFPQPSGKQTTPIAEDGTLSVAELDWITPSDSKTLAYFLERQKGKMSHNHVMTVFDITKDSHVGTITKSHHKIQPENWIKHPDKENCFAYLKADHVRKIQGIPPHLHLGSSNKLQVESMGQSVCYPTFLQIAQSLHSFLAGSYALLTKAVQSVRPAETPYEEDAGQLMFAL